jgi:hypothetical protein
LLGLNHSARDTFSGDKVNLLERSAAAASLRAWVARLALRLLALPST